MKILLAIDAPLFYADAPPSRLLYIAKSLKRKGLNVELLGKRGEEMTDLETTTVMGGKHLARLKLLFLILKKMVIEGYSQVIIRGAYIAFFLLPLRVFRKKVIIDFHDWNFREIKLYYEKAIYNAFKTLFYYITERTATKHSDLIMCASKGLQLLLSEEERRKSVLLENGLDMREAEEAIQEAEENKGKLLEKYGIPRNKPLAAFLGNWERKLDMETMLEGCEKAGINLVIVGEGPNIAKYRKRYKNTILTGKLPKLEALSVISTCDITITPYKEDEEDKLAYYSTRKVKDYLSLGKPMLIADVRGREAFLIPYDNAVFYSPSDSEDLAEKIKMLVRDQNLREKMRRNNLELACQFDWQALVDKSGLVEKLLEP